MNHMTYFKFKNEFQKRMHNNNSYDVERFECIGYFLNEDF